MNERIRKMALAALEDNSCPPSLPEHCSDSRELEDPVAIANGWRRYLLKQPVEVRQEELLADRYRFSACDYPSDYYRRGGHTHLNRAWDLCCSASHPNDLYY